MHQTVWPFKQCIHVIILFFPFLFVFGIALLPDGKSIPQSSEIVGFSNLLLTDLHVRDGGTYVCSTRDPRNISTVQQVEATINVLGKFTAKLSSPFWFGLIIKQNKIQNMLWYTQITEFAVFEKLLQWRVIKRIVCNICDVSVYYFCEVKCQPHWIMKPKKVDLDVYVRQAIKATLK